jgi:hypothetical protein
LFSIFPAVMSLHLNNWCCVRVPQHRYFLLRREVPLGFRQLCVSSAIIGGATIGTNILQQFFRNIFTF